jgi:hypothetical protein
MLTCCLWTCAPHQLLVPLQTVPALGAGSHAGIALARRILSGQRCSPRLVHHFLHVVKQFLQVEGGVGYTSPEKTSRGTAYLRRYHDSLDMIMMYIQATRSDLQKEVEKIAWV